MILIKVLAVLLILATGLCGGLVPFGMDVGAAGRRRLTLGNAFAGGVFLGAGIIHLLSDADELFGQWFSGTDFPIAAVVCGFSFFLVLSLEKVVVRGRAVEGLSQGRQIYPMVLFLVLSIHSVIAGVSLGLESALTSSLALLLAIVAHKGSAAFALGVSLCQTGLRSAEARRIVVLFSCMTPLGVLIGTLVQQVVGSGTATATEAVFDATAAGTFLYIAVADILEEVFAEAEDLWAKLILGLAGFGLMALVAIWA
jgi:zinc transporter 1/2/3